MAKSPFSRPRRVRWRRAAQATAASFDLGLDAELKTVASAAEACALLASQAAILRFGELLLEREPVEAVECMRFALGRAATLDEECAARMALESALRTAVPRWHFPMLNDRIRNEAYDEALRRSVAPGSRVLDIGCGTALHSIFAARHGAASVLAVDMDAALCEVARSVKERHVDVAGRIEVVNVSSLDIDDGAFDVIVCELFDAVVLGESILPTLHHARDNLLKRNGVIIPSCALITAMPICSAALRSKHTLNPDVPEILSCMTLLTEDTYTCETLHEYPHTPLASAQQVLKIDFPGTMRGAGPVTTFDICTPGTVDGIAVWFAAELVKGVWLDTAPGRNDCAWQHGLFYVAGGVEVESGDRLDVLCSFCGEDLQFQLSLCKAAEMGVSSASPRDALSQKVWLDGGEPTLGARWVDLVSSATPVGGLAVPESQWMDINDGTWWRSVRQAVIETKPDLVVDLSRDIPVAAMMAASEGKCRAYSAADRDLALGPLQILDGLWMSKKCSGEELLSSVLQDDQCSSGNSVLLHAKLTDSGGALRPEAMEAMMQAGALLRQSGCNIIAAPPSLTIWICGLEAPRLAQRSRTIPGLQCGVDVSPMDDWSVPSFFGDDLCGARALTDRVAALTVDLSVLQDITVRVTIVASCSGELTALQYSTDGGGNGNGGGVLLQRSRSIHAGSKLDVDVRFCRFGLILAEVPQ